MAEKATKVAKSNSLKELGYTIKSMSGKDSKGNEIIAKVTGSAPVYWIKQTKKGRVIATKEKDSTVESTIEGLFNFKAENEDLIGQRQTSSKPTNSAAEPANAVAA